MTMMSMIMVMMMMLMMRCVESDRGGDDDNDDNDDDDGATPQRPMDMTNSIARWAGPLPLTMMTNMIILTIMMSKEICHVHLAHTRPRAEAQAAHTCRLAESCCFKKFLHSKKINRHWVARRLRPQRASPIRFIMYMTHRLPTPAGRPSHVASYVITLENPNNNTP